MLFFPTKVKEIWSYYGVERGGGGGWKLFPSPKHKWKCWVYCFRLRNHLLLCSAEYNNRDCLCVALKQLPAAALWASWTVCWFKKKRNYFQGFLYGKCTWLRSFLNLLSSCLWTTDCACGTHDLSYSVYSVARTVQHNYLHLESVREQLLPTLFLHDIFLFVCLFAPETLKPPLPTPPKNCPNRMESAKFYLKAFKYLNVKAGVWLCYTRSRKKSETWEENGHITQKINEQIEAAFTEAVLSGSDSKEKNPQTLKLITGLWTMQCDKDILWAASVCFFCFFLSLIWAERFRRTAC